MCIRDSGTSVESIVTNEIVKLVTSSFCGEGLKSTLISLFGKLWKIIVLYGVQYFIKNTKGLSSFLSSIFRLCFYKKITLNIKDNESVDFLFTKRLKLFSLQMVRIKKLNLLMDLGYMAKK